MANNNCDRLTRRFKRNSATVWRCEIWCGIVMGSMGIGFTVYLMGHPSNCAINMLSLGDNISRNLLQNVEHTSKQRGLDFHPDINIFTRFPLFLYILNQMSNQKEDGEMDNSPVLKGFLQIASTTNAQRHTWHVRTCPVAQRSNPMKRGNTAWRIWQSSE